MRAPAPAYAVSLNEATIELATATLVDLIERSQEKVGEVSLFVRRDGLVEAMRLLRDTPGLDYQQLMEIAGVDYPDRPERFECVYMLLSLTRNHRIQVRVSTDEDSAVPSVTGLWPVAGWLEREVYDLFGVLFSGNHDLRRILTDYGFKGHPLLKDFPLTGYVEYRYSEEAKRVIYEPVKLQQDLRTFDFLSPWEGAQYVLPGDEKAAMGEAKGAQTPATADQVGKVGAAQTPAKEPKGDSASYAAGTNSAGGTGKDAGNNASEKPKGADVVPSKGQGQNQ